MNRHAFLCAVFLTIVILGTGCANPSLVKEFSSTSGRTAILYYTYDSGKCGSGTSCNFHDIIRTRPGYDQAEVFLSGFTLKTESKVDSILRAKAEVQKFRYDVTTGDMEVGINGGLRTANVQDYSYQINFVVLLTDATVAKLSHIGGGCGGVDQCNITRSVAGAVPQNMHYIGLGTRIFDIGSDSGPLTINTLGVHTNNVNLSLLPEVIVDYMCSMRNAAGGNKMFCEWDASVIAFDPMEMEQLMGPIFPPYTFLGHNIIGAQRFTKQNKPKSAANITGFLNAFEGLALFYPTGQEYDIWYIESSASNFRTSGTPADTALTDYGIFLGTRFGDRNNAQPYGYQESRAFGFLR